MERLEDVFDLFSKFDIPDEGFSFENGLYDPQRERPQRPQFDPPRAFALPFGFHRGEAVDQIPSPLGVVDPEEAEAVLVDKIEVGHPVFVFHRFKHRLPF